MSRSEFIDLFNTKFQNKSDEPEAKKSLAAIKEKCTYCQIDIGSYMMRSNSEKSEKINLRSFKIAINDLKCLTLYQIENLAKYMDVDNEGFISINNFVASVSNSNTFGASFGRTSPRRRLDQSMGSTKKSDTMRSTHAHARTNKWN